MRKLFYVLLVCFVALFAVGCGDSPEETKKAQADNPTVVIVIPQDDSTNLDKSLDEELSKFVDTMKIKVESLPDKTNRNLSLTTTFTDTGTGSTVTEFGLHEVDGILAAVEVIIPGIGKKAMLMRADDNSNPVVVLCRGGQCARATGPLPELAPIFTDARDFVTRYHKKKKIADKEWQEFFKKNLNLIQDRYLYDIGEDDKSNPLLNPPSYPNQTSPDTTL